MLRDFISGELFSKEFLTLKKIVKSSELNDLKVI